MLIFSGPEPVHILFGTEHKHRTDSEWTYYSHYYVLRGLQIFLKRFICLVEVNNTVNYTQTIKMFRDEGRYHIYPICTITSLGRPHAPRGGGGAKLQKLAQYYHHHAVICSSCSSCSTVSQQTTPEEVTWLVTKIWQIWTF